VKGEVYSLAPPRASATINPGVIDPGPWSASDLPVPGGKGKGKGKGRFGDQ
jgi:hypothetical protein